MNEEKNAIDKIIQPYKKYNELFCQRFELSVPFISISITEYLVEVIVITMISDCRRWVT